jgi:hypothetical protein
MYTPEFYGHSSQEIFLSIKALSLSSAPYTPTPETVFGISTTIEVVF